MVILTSFRYMNDFVGKKFSVARWAPKGLSISAIECLAALGINDKELHLKDFNNPIKEFANVYREGLKARWSQVETWLGELDPLEDVVLACWCPYSKSSLEYLKSHQDGFLCHTGLIGKLIQKHRPDIDVVMDEDRLNHLVKEWRPNE